MIAKHREGIFILKFSYSGNRISPKHIDIFLFSLKMSPHSYPPLQGLFLFIWAYGLVFRGRQPYFLVGIFDSLSHLTSESVSKFSLLTIIPFALKHTTHTQKVKRPTTAGSTVARTYIVIRLPYKARLSNAT